MKYLWVIFLMAFEATAANVSINFSDSSVKTNAQGTFDIGKPVFDSTDQIWEPGPQPAGTGELVTPSGTWCMAFKGAFEGFRMGINSNITFLGHPSMVYKFGPSAPGSQFACSSTNPCFAGVAGHGADRAIHQSPSRDCLLAGSQYNGTGGVSGIGMMVNKPVYIGMAIHVNSKEWGFDNSSSEPVIFELFQPDLLLLLGNTNLNFITLADHPGVKVPFTADIWNYIIVELFANSVIPSESFVTIWKVTPAKGDWLNATATPSVNLPNYKFSFDKGLTWTFNWGIYRGKKKVSQAIKFGQINIGDTMSFAMPQP